MKRRHGLLTLTLVFAVSSQVAEAKDLFVAEKAKARGYFELLRQKNYKAVLEASDAAVRKALPEDKLKEAWEGVLGSYGAYESEVGASAEAESGYVVVNLVSKFKSGTLVVRFTLDAKHKIAGLFFTPYTQTVDYETPDYADQSAFSEEDVTVSAGKKFPLPGTLTLPKGTKPPFPAVVLVHGSGPNDRDETIFARKPFKDLAWGLATRGIAVLRYDKRTLKHGQSMDPAKITIDDETADDAIAAVRLLSRRKDIAGDRIFIIGHSLGATAAPYIAAREKKVAGIVMLAAAARPIHELVEEQIPYLAKIDGKLTKAEEAKIKETKDVVKKLREGNWKPGDTLLGAPAAYWAGLMKLEPVKNAKTLKRPILIIHGGRDYQVTNTDYKLWKQKLGGRQNVSLMRFNNLDHLFCAGEGPSSPQQYAEKGNVDRKVIDLVTTWITQ